MKRQKPLQRKTPLKRKGYVRKKKRTMNQARPKITWANPDSFRMITQPPCPAHIRNSKVPGQHELWMKELDAWKEEQTEKGFIPFASETEAERYLELRAREKNGEILDLDYQVGYELHRLDGKRATTYYLDFQYREKGKLVVEDRKGGIRTEAYKIKRSLFEGEYPGIEFKET